VRIQSDLPKTVKTVQREFAARIHRAEAAVRMRETPVKGQDIVYANLAGEVDQMAKDIIASMKANDVKRLIFDSRAPSDQG
jgi:hypothetical protein